MKKLIQNCISTLLCAQCLALPLMAGESISDYAKEIPGIGLISDSIQFDGFTVSDFYFNNEKKFIFVKPGEEFSASMKYAIDASALKTLERHHFIYGLYNDNSKDENNDGSKGGPQGCLVHSYGFNNKEGSVTVDFTAPQEAGVYQVRFCHAVGLTDEEAYKAWWNGEHPSAKTIVGIVVVK